MHRANDVRPVAASAPRIGDRRTDHHHAVVATTTYLGYFRLQRQLPDEPVFGVEAEPYLRHLWRVLEAELAEATR
jgi:hypothetical protein